MQANTDVTEEPKPSPPWQGRRAHLNWEELVVLADEFPFTALAVSFEERLRLIEQALHVIGRDQIRHELPDELVSREPKHATRDTVDVDAAALVVGDENPIGREFA